jgi:hypothetical protein
LVIDQKSRDILVEPSEPHLSGDSPKTRIAEDEFGLKAIVKALARASTSQISSDGYVIGIEGSWGSGKTTLVNFVAESLKVTPDHEVIFFDPWLVGEKNAALALFLGQLATTIEKVEDATHSFWRLDYWLFKRLRKTLANQIRKYGKYAVALATPVGSLSAVDPTGAASLTAAGLKATGWLSKLLERKPSVADLKKAIGSNLLKLKKQQPSLRITAIVDDTDRLDPQEAAEILRLVRNVADFPLLTYLVCFDRTVLSHQIKTALKVKDGNLYIDKIFQSIVLVPPQEPFALRRYLRRELARSFPRAMETSNTDDQRYLEHIVLDVWAGRFLQTPRDVVRVHEVIALGWPNISEESNFLDFVWLQLIKLKFPELYKWTENYLMNVSAMRDGGRPGDTEPKKHAVELQTLLAKHDWADAAYRCGLGEILPGVNQFCLEGKNQKVYEFEHDELAKFERRARLGSPTHWRKYFAFDLPTYAVSDEFIRQFRTALTQDPSSAIKLIRAMLDRPHPRRGHFVDVLLDRLIDIPDDSFSKLEREGLVLAFADIADYLAKETVEFSEFGRSSILRKSLRLMAVEAAPIFSKIVKTGKSINWIASVLNDQCIAYGLPNGGRTESQRQWLPRKQLDVDLLAYAKRLLATSYRTVFTAPEPREIIFLMLRFTDADAFKNYVQKAARSEAGFLTTLKALTSWSSSSHDGVRHPLYRDTVQKFMDADRAKTRLQKIEKRTKKDTNRQIARFLLKEWSDDKID